MHGALPQPVELAPLDAIEALGLFKDDVEEALARAVRLLRDCIGAPMAAFTIIGKDRQRFVSTIGMGDCKPPREGSLCGHAVMQSEVLEVSDARLDERFARNPLVLGSPKLRFYGGLVINAPNGSPIGAICVIDTRPRKLSETQIRQFHDIKFLVEEILQFRSLSLRDPLTGLFNRRYFDEMLSREWQRARRRELPLSALLIDIDYFKDYNDHYGHPQGDHCLKVLSIVLRAAVNRAGDHLARYGGEEFALILPDTSLAGAEILAERLRLAILDAGQANAGSPFARVTISIGGATATANSDSTDDAASLIQAADNALYIAKHDGRNRCVVRGAGSLAIIDQS